MLHEIDIKGWVFLPHLCQSLIQAIQVHRKKRAIETFYVHLGFHFRHIGYVVVATAVEGSQKQQGEKTIYHMLSNEVGVLNIARHGP
jgi:heme/copper-type cytochrome/quinol oxidase subunit 3